MTSSQMVNGQDKRNDYWKAFITFSALRLLWYVINTYAIDFTVVLRFIPLPWALFNSSSVVVWLVDLVLTIYQGLAIYRLVLPGIRFARGSPHTGSSAESGPTPRSRSWLPTALLLCGLLTVSCCVIGWFIAMGRFGVWFPLEDYLLYDGPIPIAVGAVLSVLGLLFGGRYVARAASDVNTSFGVTPLDEGHWLTQRVHALADALKLPRPAVGMTNVINAFAMGADQKSAMVVIGKPLLDYEKDELDAIIGHELGHILHNDVARMQFAEGFQRMLVNVVNLLTIVGAVLAATATKSSKRSNAEAQLNVQLTKLVGAAARQTLFVGTELVTKGISRNREFHADAVGAHVTSPDAMGRALKRIHGVVEKPTAQERHYGYLMFRGARFGRLFSTHPTLNARLAALKVGQVAAEPTASEKPQPAATAPKTPPGPSPLWAELKTVSRLTGQALVGVQQISRRQFSRVRIKPRRVLMMLIGCAALALVAPALIGFYGLDQRWAQMRATVDQSVARSASWAGGIRNAWTHDDDRARELDAREANVRAREASLAADHGNQSTELQQAKALTATALADLDRARQDARDLQQKLDAANADRSALNTRVTAAQSGSPPAGTGQRELQQQVAQLQKQLSDMIVDKSILAARVAEQEKLIEARANAIAESPSDRAQIADLQGQLNTLKAANTALSERADAQTRTISEWANDRVAMQKQITELTTQLESQPTLAAPAATPSAPLQKFAAFAEARNGVVFLTPQLFTTENEARQGALAGCRGFSNGSACQVKSVFSKACAAVARVSPVTRRSPYSFQLGGSPGDAEEMALSECYQANGRPCQITVPAVCTD
ncbi:DUF4189 domain-containing protein [Rhizobium leguminosarum]|uniref:M48 family metalloprotease n=1 Tax=Rhizobium leguminosarum TaxID=384 RepID=UPI0010317BD6|nr:M48 family metalloprotease [Rhizobium leguminosarum]TBD04563.1 DUF4189 domain-containing protein [Rhizobium leguminosarum]